MHLFMADGVAGYEVHTPESISLTPTTRQFRGCRGLRSIQFYDVVGVVFVPAVRAQIRDCSGCLGTDSAQ